MKNWVLILGASSGIGAECAKAFAKKGLNIFGVYLRKPKSHIEKLTKEIESFNVQVIFKKANAANADSRKQIMNELTIQKKVELDVEYLNNISFFFDLKIICLTFINTLRGVGISH